MMNIPKYLALLLFCTAFSAFAHAAQIMLQGVIFNPVSDKVVLKEDSPLPDETPWIAHLDEKGRFSIQVETDHPAYYQFRHGNEYTGMYLEPGFDIVLTLDTKSFDESVTYTGTGAAENNYLALKYLTEEKLRADAQPFYAPPAPVFLKKAAAIRREVEKIFLDPDLQQQLSEHFKHLERQSIGYQWADEALKYLQMNRQSIEENPQDAGALKPAYTHLSTNRPEDLPIPAFRTFLQDLVFNKAMALRPEKEPPNDLDLKWAAIDALVQNPKVKEYIRAEVLMQQALYMGIDVNPRILEDFKQRCTEKRYLAAIDKALKDWAHLQPGMPAPGFSCADTKDAPFALNSLRGKYVYIDCWATWCGPCRREIPYLMKLEERMAGYNLAFVCISLDTDRQAWLDMLREQGMKGIQLYANGFQSDIALRYNVKSIPRFILIDPEGNIVHANAPRPSEGAESYLKNLLESR